MKAILIGAAAVAALAAPGPSTASAQPKAVSMPAKPAPLKSGRVPINGIDYYYEVYGKGEPVLLLHGGLGSIDLYEPGMPKLAQNRQVVAVDLQGHGRTPLGNRPIDLVAIGDDLSGLLTKLGYK